jgi:hypothetical protein
MAAAELADVKRAARAGEMFAQVRLEALDVERFTRPYFDRIVHPRRFDARG